MKIVITQRHHQLIISLCFLLRRSNTKLKFSSPQKPVANDSEVRPKTTKKIAVVSPEPRLADQTLQDVLNQLGQSDVEETELKSFTSIEEVYDKNVNYKCLECQWTSNDFSEIKSHFKTMGEDRYFEHLYVVFRSQQKDGKPQKETALTSVLRCRRCKSYFASKWNAKQHASKCWKIFGKQVQHQRSENTQQRYAFIFFVYRCFFN